MADVKWIKITTDVFDDEKILLIESLPEADSIIVIWFKLLCLAGKQNNSGVFMMGNSIPYTDKMLATIFRRKESTVQLALQTFQQFGMVELIDGVITIPNWGKHQNLDQLESKKQYMKNYMRDYREKQKLLSCKDNCKTNSKANVSEADKNKIREDKNREDKNDILSDSDESTPAKPKKEKPTKHKYGEYQQVLLTDVEYDKLLEEYGQAMTSNAVTFLDEYIEMKGYKAKSHYLAIRKWVIDAVKERDRKQGRKEIVPEWMNKKKPNSFNDYEQREYDFDDLERRLAGVPTAGTDESIKARAEALQERLTR